MLGKEDGSADGMEDGSVDGSTDGSVDGTMLGTKVGTSDSPTVGKVDSTTDGVVEVALMVGLIEGDANIVGTVVVDVKVGRPVSGGTVVTAIDGANVSSISSSVTSTVGVPVTVTGVDVCSLAISVEITVGAAVSGATVTAGVATIGSIEASVFSN